MSITAACANIGVWEGALSGLIGGMLACRSREVLEYLQVDDPVGAIPVHLVGGVWGLLVPAFFHRADGYGPSTLPGAFYGGGARPLGIQVLGTLVLIAWGAVGTQLFLFALSCLMAVRVSKKDEKRGLDASEHGILPPNAEHHARPPRGKSAARKFVLRKLARGRKKAEGGSPERRRIDEFVEDVGHAANVSAAVTTFALTLRRRSLARKFASGAHGGVAQHRASQTQMAVGRHVGHGADAASCTDSSDGVHDGVAAVVASDSAS